eukprot:TRINITY_DN23799_c0_g1_i1.p1 TRINITY_DN23799_c0_g1~~TRINITY_DN23799_c0_g1_i1.p1  ORF type:complete len:487 (-),score=38.24 TRINITY_DN23799_c0_g1_i1:147-1607(-)
MAHKSWSLIFIFCTTCCCIPRQEDVVRHLHLAFGDSLGSIRVGFSTNRSTWPTTFSSVCRYWPENDEQSAKIVENSFVRSYDPSVWNPHQALPWDLRFVQLSNLRAGSRYGLQCGVRNTTSMRLFLSPNATQFDVRTQSTQWSFVAFGDLGVESSDLAEGHYAVGFTRRRLENEVLNGSARFVLHYGDISYAQGNDKVWDEFMDSIEPVASKVPWMVSPGNHDIQPPDSGNELGVPYSARFWMPSQCKGNPYWYSFDHGGVHFISLSTEHEFGSSTAQLQFLETDLKQALGKQPFIVVVGHRPLLSSHMSFGKDHDALSKGQWKAWQPLFEKYKVDLTLWGHIHAYERIMYGEMPVISSGMAGQSYCCGAWEYDPPDWSKYREDSHGYLRVGVNLKQSPPSLRVEYVRSDDGKVYDAFTIFAHNHATGVRKPLLEHMPERSNRGNVSLHQSIQGQCTHEEGVAVALSPQLPRGLCPSGDNLAEFVV